MKQRPRRVPSGRKCGGQPGHQGQTRVLVPIEDVDTVVPIKLRKCLRCQHPLQGEDPQPYQYQVPELPVVKPIVTEYQLHRLCCPACGTPTRADVPRGVPSGGFGPRVQAVMALCTGVPVEAYDPGGHSRPVRPTPESRDDSTSGADDRAGRGDTSGRSPSLSPYATHCTPGRDEMARRAHARLVVGRGDHLGHCLRGPLVAWG